MTHDLMTQDSKTHDLTTRDLTTTQNLLNLVNGLRRSEFKVFYRKYYDHNVFAVFSKKDWFLADVVVSQKEAIVPPDQINEFIDVSKRVLQELRKRYSNTRLNFSGSMTFVVANVAERNVYGKVVKWKDGKTTHAIYTIKKCDDWFYLVIDKIVKWVKDRHKKLSEYCRAKNEDPRKNALLKELERLYDALSTIVKKVRRALPIQPETKAITGVAAGMLKSMGIEATAIRVTRLSNLLRIATGKGEPLDESKTVQALRHVCIELPNRAFLALKSIVAKCSQFIKCKVEQIRLVRAEDFHDKSQAIILYPLHWMTKRGIVPKSWDIARGIIHALADIAGIDVDGSFLDKLEKAVPSPAILLTPDAAHKAWAMIYRRR